MGAILRRFTLVLFVAAAFAGCGKPSPDIVQGPAGHNHTGLLGSLAVDTVEKLTERSDKVAVVEVLNEDWRGDVNGFARVIFRVRVVESMKGTEVDEVFRFSQPDPARQVGIWVAPEVRVGDQYLMFLTKLDVSWVGESVYVKIADGWTRRVQLDGGASTPARIADGELQNVLRRLESVADSP